MLRVYWLKELRTLFRDRNILLYGLALPLFLYPGLLFAVAQIRLSSEGLAERIKPVVALVHAQELPRAARLLRIIKTRSEGVIDVVSLKGSAERLLLASEIDLAIVPGDEGRLLRLVYDSRRSTSVLALDRVRPLADEFRAEVEVDAGRLVGVRPEALTDTDILKIDIAKGSKQSGHLISLVLPLILIVMCSFGATYPAIELTAGERERSSSETTLLLPLSRRTVALGKTLAVACAAFVALLVNLLAMALSIGPMLASGEGGAIVLPDFAWHTGVVILAFGAILSLVFASLFLLVGSYARNYREAQAFVTPLQLLTIMPALLTLWPGTTLDPLTALIPIYNVGVTFREALQGSLSPLPFLVSLASLGVVASICIKMTVRRLADTASVLGFRDPDAVSGVGA